MWAWRVSSFTTIARSACPRLQKVSETDERLKCRNSVLVGKERGNPLCSAPIEMEYVKMLTMMPASSMSGTVCFCTPRGILEEICYNVVLSWYCTAAGWFICQQNGTEEIVENNELGCLAVDIDRSASQFPSFLLLNNIIVYISFALFRSFFCLLICDVLETICSSFASFLLHWRCFLFLNFYFFKIWKTNTHTQHFIRYKSTF